MKQRTLAFDAIWERTAAGLLAVFQSSALSFNFWYKPILYSLSRYCPLAVNGTPRFRSCHRLPEFSGSLWGLSGGVVCPADPCNNRRAVSRLLFREPDATPQSFLEIPVKFIFGKGSSQWRPAAVCVCFGLWLLSRQPLLWLPLTSFSRSNGIFHEIVESQRNLDWFKSPQDGPRLKNLLTQYSRINKYWKTHCLNNYRHTRTERCASAPAAHGVI